MAVNKDTKVQIDSNIQHPTARHIGRAGIACIYHESLDNSIKVCKYDDYKRYIWIEVTLGKEKLYIVACYIPHKDSNYYSRFGLDCDDPFTELCHDILSFEKLGKVLIMGDFNARVGNFQNVETFEENVVEHCLLRDSEDCVMSDYGKLLIHMLNCTNLIILNGTKAFPSTNVLTCLPSSGGGSVVDYALMLACDLSLVNVFKVGSLSPDSDHKPLYLELAIPHFTNRCHGVKDEKRCIIRPCYEKAKMYANEVENHLLKFSLSNDVKENWQHLKDIILKVGYQYFKRHVGGHKMSSFPCNSWFNDKCKMYLKWF